MKIAAATPIRMIFYTAPASQPMVLSDQIAKMTATKPASAPALPAATNLSGRQPWIVLNLELHLFPLFILHILLNCLHVTAVVQSVVQAFLFFFTHAVKTLAIDNWFCKNTGFIAAIHTGKTESVIFPIENRKGKT